MNSSLTKEGQAMNKLNELRKTKDVVTDILEQNTRARNDDAYLYLLVVKEFNSVAPDYPLELFLTDPMFNDIPCFETVRRARQRVQALRPELASDKRIEKLRHEQEQDYKAFASEI